MSDIGNYTLTNGGSVTESSTLTTDGSETFSASIPDFVPGGTVDISGLASVNSATLTDDTLSLTRAGGPTVNLQLNSTGSYDPDGVLLAPDGSGGTDVTLQSSGLSEGGFTGPNEILLEADPAFYAGQVDDDDNFISDWSLGDTIILPGVQGAYGGSNPLFGGIYLGSSAALGLSNLGAVAITFPSPPQDGSTLTAVYSNGATDITLGGATALSGDTVTYGSLEDFKPTYSRAETVETLGGITLSQIQRNVYLTGDGVTTNFTIEDSSFLTATCLYVTSNGTSPPTIEVGGFYDNSSTGIYGFLWNSRTDLDTVFTILGAVESPGTYLSAVSISGIVAGTFVTGITPAGVVTGVISTAQGYEQFTAAPPCFRSGTKVLTREGERRVEELAVGDRVVTAEGYTEPVMWIGYRGVDCRTHSAPQKVWPVRVQKGAFDENCPHRDLWLSPDHAVLVNGVLIPIKLLLNGASIEQVPTDMVTYYHVELPEHAVLLVEGLPAESYLDTGNRFNFENSGGLIAHANWTYRPDFGAIVY